jgi:hypothetical protein
MGSEFMTVVRQGEKLGALFIGVATEDDGKTLVKHTVLDADLMLTKNQEGKRAFLDYFNSRGIGEFTIGHALAEIYQATQDIEQGTIALERIPTVESFLNALGSTTPEPLAP